MVKEGLFQVRNQISQNLGSGVGPKRFPLIPYTTNNNKIVQVWNQISQKLRIIPILAFNLCILVAPSQEHQHHRPGGSTKIREFKEQMICDFK